MSKIPQKYIIDDPRKAKDFKSMTFSGYQRRQVANVLYQSIKSGLLEDACYWAGELQASGNQKEFWKQIFLACSKEINTASPRLPSHLWSKYLEEQELESGNSIDLRNSQTARNRLAEVVSLVTLADKNEIMAPKLNDNDYKMSRVRELGVANDTHLISGVFKSTDPKELEYPINEFCTYLHMRGKEYSNTRFITNNTNSISYGAVYWLYWIFRWEKTLIKQRGKYECATRSIHGVKPTHHRDLIWMLWECILEESGKRDSRVIHMQVLSLFEMFKLNYNKSAKSQKIDHLKHAIVLLMESTNLNWKKGFIQQEMYYIRAVGNINKIYFRLRTEVTNDFVQKLLKDHYQAKEREKEIQKEEMFGEEILNESHPDDETLRAKSIARKILQQEKAEKKSGTKKTKSKSKKKKKEYQVPIVLTDKIPLPIKAEFQKNNGSFDKTFRADNVEIKEINISGKGLAHLGEDFGNSNTRRKGTHMEIIKMGDDSVPNTTYKAVGVNNVSQNQSGGWVLSKDWSKERDRELSGGLKKKKKELQEVMGDFHKILEEEKKNKKGIEKTMEDIDKLIEADGLIGDSSADMGNIKVISIGDDSRDLLHKYPSVVKVKKEKN